MISLLSSPATGLLALLLGCVSVAAYYVAYRRAPPPKQARSSGMYVIAAAGAGFMGFVAGMSLGIVLACFTEGAGNLCGLAGIFGTGPIAAGLAMLTYAHLWHRSARRP